VTDHNLTLPEFGVGNVLRGHDRCRSREGGGQGGAQSRNLRGDKPLLGRPAGPLGRAQWIYSSRDRGEAVRKKKKKDEQKISHAI